ncbi:MAG: hypothetical protein QNJ54_32255 [Prochloraceae cyanobacterium]|nr:hypothetical protein [Prochloraceae cyanobacterium]
MPTNSVANAPVAKAESEYPVLIFSHGFGDLPELNTIKAEELASQGYVVVAINHTYDSTVNTFPDGRVIPQSSIFNQAKNQSELIELLDRSVSIRAKDAQFVLNELEKIDAGNDPRGLFKEKLNLDRVGIYGYSLGGATAAKVLSIDPRFQAGINLDGGLIGDVAEAKVSQPFMFLNNEVFGKGNSPNAELRKFNQIQQSFVNNLQNKGYEVTILGTDHSNFNDLPFIFSRLVNSGIELGNLNQLLNPNNNDFKPIDPQRGAQIINDYTTAFFDQHLKNQESSLLADTSSPYPEVIFQSYPNPPELQFGTVNADVLEIDSPEKLVFAGSGKDIIDSSNSGENNRTYAGSGNDEIVTGKSQRAFGEIGDDTIDSSAGVGSNRSYGGDGNDELIAGNNDRLFGGNGNDTLDSSLGGNNRLYGGVGNDLFFLGNRDRAIGALGDDRFFVGVSGGNTITGGRGADRFWVVASGLPQNSNTITDLEVSDVIGIGGGYTRADLSFREVNGNGILTVVGVDVATFRGVTLTELQNANFAFA